MADISFGYLTLPHCDAPTVLKAAAAAGLHRAGLRIAGRRSSDEGDWVLGNLQAVEELKRLAEDLNISIESVTAFYVDEATTPQQFLPVFEAASRLSSKYICVSGYDGDHDRLNHTLNELGETAKQFEKSLAFEFVPYSKVRSLQEALRVLAGVPDDAAGVVLDMMHFVRSGGYPDLINSSAAKRIAFAQICDGSSLSPPLDRLADEARTARLFPGLGQFPIREILLKLQKNTLIEIEIPQLALQNLSPADQAILTVEKVTEYLSPQPQRLP